MSRPSNLVVDPLTYALIWTHGLVENSSGEESFGVTDTEHLTIELDTRAAAQRLRVTLAHEALHALNDASGADELLGDREELFVKITAPALVRMLRANPRFVAELMEGITF